MLGDRMKFRINHGGKMATTFSLKDTSSFDNISWNYMRSLKEMSDVLEITEITSPQDKRTGRRVFDFLLPEGDRPKTKIRTYNENAHIATRSQYEHFS